MSDKSKSKAELIRELEALRREVTELKAVSAERDCVEADLRENEARYRQLVDALPDAVVVHREGILLFANPAAAKMFGVEATGQFIGKLIWQFVHPDDRERVQQRTRQAMNGVGLPIVEHRLVRLDGAVIEAETHSALVTYGGAPAVQTILRDVTDLNRAERSIRALLDAALEAVFLIEPDGALLTANQTFVQRFGRTLDELIGSDAYALLKPDVAKSRRARVSEVAHTGHPVRYEDEYDGRHFSNSIYPVVDDRGQVTALAIYARDITEQKQAELALRESEERYRRFVDTMPDAMFVHCEGVIRFANPAAAQMVGAGHPDELIGRSSWDFVHPDDWESARQRTADMLAGEEAPVVDQRFLRLDGTVVDVQVRSSPVVYQGQTAIQTVARDVTDARRTERSFRALLDAALDFIFLMEPDGTILAANQTFGQRFGRPVEDLIGANAYDLLPPDIRAPRKARNDGAIRTGRPLRFEDEHRGLYFDNSLYPVVDAHGQVTALAIYSRDVTEQKRAEKALQLFKAVVESSNEAIVVRDATGQAIYANPAYERLLGLSLEDLQRMGDQHLYAPEVLERIAREIIPALFRGESWEGELEMSDTAGRQFPVWQRIDTLHDADGSVPYAFTLMHDITEQRRVEQALRESEATLNQSQEVAGMGSFVLNRCDNSLIWSRNMYAIAGVSPGSLAGSMNDVIAQVIHPDDRADVARQVEAMIREKRTRPIEFRLVRSDGEVRWVRAGAEFIFDEQGEVARCIGVLWDITESKRAAESLAKIQQLLRDTGRMAKVGGWEIDLDTRRVIWTEDVYRIHEAEFDYSPTVEEALSFYAPSYRPVITAAVQAAIEWGEPYDLELDLITAKGNRRRVRAIGRPEREGDRTRRVSGTFQDITDRWQAEEALRESERRYRLLAEHARDVIWTMGPDYRFTYISPSIRYLRGLEPEEAMRESIEETMTPESLRKVRDVIARRSAQTARGETYEVDYIEVQQYHKDGALVWVEIATQPIRDATGRRVGVLGVSRDITERKKLEERLLRSQKLEAVGRLASGVAHDFNNILTVIRGNTEFLLDSAPADDPRRADLESIQRAGDRAADLTRQLLAFSGRQILRPKVVNLNHLVSGVTRMLRRLVGEDVELLLDLSPDLAPVLLDPGQIEQVILNLVVNAREAMPDGGRLTIRSANVALNERDVRISADLRPGDYVELSIRDTGAGIDAETRAHIFEPFFTTKETGTGLGLATVYGVVVQSGGAITVESAPGAGATFRVYLPALDQSAPREIAPAIEKMDRVGHETVLVVEDEENVLNMVCRALREKGYTVLAAGHGEEALRLFQETPASIDLLLTDVVMPGRASGRQVAEALRALSPGLKVLFMSGYPDETIVHHGVLDNGLAFIAKPFTIAVLLRKMREVLDA